MAPLRASHTTGPAILPQGPYFKGARRIMEHQEPITGTGLRTPRAAAAAGILFSLLLSLAITLINVSAPSNPATAGDWLTDPARRAATCSRSWRAWKWS